MQYDGLTVYEASEDANKKMVVKEKLVLYDNRPADNIRRNDSYRNAMEAHGCKYFRLASYCALQGFDKEHPHTLQLVIKRQKSDSKKSIRSRSSRSFFGSKSRSLPMLFKRDTNHVLVSLKNRAMMEALEEVLEADIQRIQEEENAENSEDEDDFLAVAVDDVNLKGL